MFSTGHTITTLSARSLITSSSYSFHPIRPSSISTCCIKLMSSPCLTIPSSSLMLFAIPPPVPPRVKDGLITRGYPSSFATSNASSTVLMILLLGTSRPILIIEFLKRSLSSALFIASSFAPINSTPYLSRTPFSASIVARFSPV